jgi:hypothetical protein
MNIKELAEQANGRFEQAWPGGVIWYWDELAEFAELVAAHTLMNIDPSKFIGGYQEGFEAGVAKEREECAKVAEKRVLLDDNKDKKIGYNHACKVIAEGIRARSNL